MLDLILILHKFVNVFISISLLNLKLSHKDIKIKLKSTQLYYEGITLLCIKMFDQLKASTSPKITLLRSAFTVILISSAAMNVIANISFKSVSNSTVVG